MGQTTDVARAMLGIASWLVVAVRPSLARLEMMMVAAAVCGKESEVG